MHKICQDLNDSLVLVSPSIMCKQIDDIADLTVRPLEDYELCTSC